jgi:hypothetical protein
MWFVMNQQRIGGWQQSTDLDVPCANRAAVILGAMNLMTSQIDLALEHRHEISLHRSGF